MFGSTLSWLFTTLFGLTGAYSVARLADLDAEPHPPGNKLAEVFHLLMSIAMIAMTWALTGEVSSPGGLLQVAVFGLGTLWFSVRLARPAPGHSRVVDGHHLVTNAAMLWMVVAMPLLMTRAASGRPGGAPEQDGADEMAGMPGMGAPVPGGLGVAAGSSGPSAWVAILSWFVLALLVGSAGLRLVRILRLPGRRTPSTSRDAPPRPGPRPDRARTGDTVGVATSPTTSRPAEPLLDAGCHLLMTAGTAGMLLAML